MGLLFHAFRIGPQTGTGVVRSSLVLHSFRCSSAQYRRLSSVREIDNTNVAHSKFIAEAKPGSSWNKGTADMCKSGDIPDDDDFHSIKEGKGKLSPTSSHLFKFILPLGRFDKHPASTNKHGDTKPPPPMVILLHPSQPLSHVSRLIQGSLAPGYTNISFRSMSLNGQTFQWSDSTDVGDFIRDAARVAEFSIHIIPEPSSEKEETIISVEVPTFADRTRYLRRRLDMINRELSQMEGIKRECDREAQRGVRRMAVSGFGMLLMYWAAVARLTFWDYGWDVMEPITYLSGLSTVICGYLWFLYQGREVSYSSVLDRSISSRREALYKSQGLDIDRWLDLVSDGKSIRREIRKIAEDYDEGNQTKVEDAEKEDGEARKN